MDLLFGSSVLQTSRTKGMCPYILKLCFKALGPLTVSLPRSFNCEARWADHMPSGAAQKPEVQKIPSQ